jgi:glycosyltransferase involved in cell wall biosynthesis
MKKICFFTTTFSSHEQVRMFYAEKYFPADVELFLITPHSQNKYQLNRTKIIEPSENKLKFIIFLRKFCRKNKIDLLLNLGTYREVYASFLATIFSKTRFTINEHGDVINYPKLKNNFFSKLADRIDQIFVFTMYHFSKSVVLGAKDQAEELRKYLFLMKKKIYCLPLIIDEKTFNIKNKIKMRKKLNLPIKKDILIFVGRISYLKGSDILYGLAEKNKDKLFLLIGNELDKKFSEKKLENVILLGPKNVEDLVEYYSASDLSILPSRVEGFGLVSRESMLCGTPALVSNILALKSIPGAILSENNINEMQAKIDEFFSIPQKQREENGLKLRKLIIDETSYDKLKEKYLEIFYK